MKKIITALSAAGLACALALTVVATASASSGVTATVGVTAGTLSMSTSATPSGSVTLNGTDQNTSFGIPLSVTDATGSGAGWNVTVTSTQFSTGGATPKLLSTSASSITAVSSSCNASVTCTNPTNAITYPLAVPAGSGPPTAVKLFNAAANSGMGAFTVTPTMQVAVPANTLAGSYTSTVTVAIVSGP